MKLDVAMLNLRPGESPAFERAFAQAQTIIATMPGYLSHELQRCLEAPDKYPLLVGWQTLADHRSVFRSLRSTMNGRRCCDTSTIPFPTVEHYATVFPEGDHRIRPYVTRFATATS